MEKGYGITRRQIGLFRGLLVKRATFGALPASAFKAENNPRDICATKGSKVTQIIDCLIIGGGPAGLTAAIYAARFHLTVKVIDASNSRAAQIPRTMNHAGFPDGISGVDLLDRMRKQAMKYDVDIAEGRVRELHKTVEGFHAQAEFGDISARAVLVATGVTNRKPQMSEVMHAEALKLGRLRYCPVCDGYEVTDQKVGVFGVGIRAMKEAEFLRSFTAKVSLLVSADRDELDERQHARLAALKVPVIPGPSHDFKLEGSGISIASGMGRLCFDTIYPALGSIVHSDLAVALGAEVTDEGCIKVDAHQRTSVRGLYAAGDVVLGLDQISHAMGEAGVSATTIRNDLVSERPLLR